MTHFTERNLNQKCVYWGSPTPDGYGGYTYADPVELDCRWEDVVMAEQGTLGSEIELRSEVQVKVDVDEQGMMLLGELDDIDSADYDNPVDAGADMIVRFNKIPTLDANHFYRKAYLGRLWTGKT